MNYTANTPVIIPAGIKGNADEIFAILDPDVGGANSFTVPLSADGSGPETHWAMYSRFSEAPVGTPPMGVYEALTGGMNNNDFRNWANSVAAERGRDPVGTVVAFRNNAIVGTPGEDFWSRIAAEGLQVVEQNPI